MPLETDLVRLADEILPKRSDQRNNSQVDWLYARLFPLPTIYFSPLPQSKDLRKFQV